uniref:Transmembrane protein n=1 Tax=Lactuca sativa TaxID=4236 RepID=A0A9R1X0A1_LACSA|nr:hypothetical protein LSAT_V11C700366150 [Lactuca sativa]
MKKDLPRKPKKEVVVEENSKKKTEKWPLVLHVDTSIFALFLIVLIGAFYVVTILSSIKVVCRMQHKHIQLFKLCSLLIHLKVFIEAYAWLSHNIEVDDKDLGLNALIHTHTHIGCYQTTTMASRTVIVDNTTWNNTHCYCWYCHVITQKSCLRIFQLFGCLVSWDTLVMI